MKANKIARNILIVLFVLFISLYISQSSGYYNYSTYKKTELTKDQIKQFEEDVKAGKNINVKDYITNIEKDYGNKISNAGLNVSKNIEKYSKKVIETVFGALSGFVTE